MRFDVLQVGKYFPPYRGGIETVAEVLAEGFDRTGLRHAVLCSSDRCLGRRQRTAGGGEIVRCGSWARIASVPISPWFGWQMSKMSRDAALVHLHMPHPLAALAVDRIPAAVPLVVHWHSDVVRQQRLMRFYEPLQHRVLERASAIVVTSERYARGSEPLQPWRSKWRVIPIGIGDNALPGVRAPDMIPESGAERRPLVLAVGRLTYYKGFDVLIRATRLLPPDIRVLIVGTGGLRPTLERLIVDCGLRHRVSLLGAVSPSELESLLGRCDVFCLPSTQRSEAFGVAMVEAMSHGCATVACDIPGSGVPWVNLDGETGLNVPPGDEQALACALRKLLFDAPLRQRMGVAARARFERHFRAERMVRRMLRLYHDVHAGAVASGDDFEWCDE